VRQLSYSKTGTTWVISVATWVISVAITQRIRSSQSAYFVAGKYHVLIRSLDIAAADCSRFNSMTSHSNFPYLLQIWFRSLFFNVDHMNVTNHDEPLFLGRPTIEVRTLPDNIFYNL
jgi:hypothetical protein